MKQKSLFILFGLFFCFYSHAQLNVARLDLSGLVIGKVQGSYEYSFGEKTSLDVSMYYMPNQGLQYLNLINFEIGNDYIDNPLEKTVYNGVGITPGIKFYTSSEKDAPRGFYIEPYLRYATYGLSSEFRYRNEDLTIANLTIDGNSTSIGGGVAMGYQFIISDLIAIDWSIFALGGASGNTVVNVQEQDLQEDLYTMITEDFEDVEKFYGTYTVEQISDNEVKATAKGFLPCIKMGLSIGIAF